MEAIVVTTPEQLKKLFREVLNEAQKANEKTQDFSERLTRFEAAKFLEVTPQTMSNYVKRGLLKPRGHGRKQFYLKPDLIEFFNRQNNV